MDRHIVGQKEAKRAVAVALRNRWRRNALPPELRDVVVPKNILMIGSTGVGKTAIAQRLALLSDAPFIKVEMSKFLKPRLQHIGVEGIVTDLVEASIRQRRQRATLEAGHAAYRDVPGVASSVLEAHEAAVRAAAAAAATAPVVPVATVDEREAQDAIRVVEQEGIVFLEEIDKLCSAQQRGGDRFADAARFLPLGAAGESVQRDLLPLLDGSAVTTSFGVVKTNHILFIASGAFHHTQPSDLLPELQGRLPIRVQLRPLSRQDLYEMLTRPGPNLIEQQIQLMRTDGIDLRFTASAIDEIARIAFEVNEAVENIGARRLATIIERVMEDISFNAPFDDDSEHAGDRDTGAGAAGEQLPAAGPARARRMKRVVIDADHVHRSVDEAFIKTDLSHFVL